jgi:hypothetical protein
MHDASFPRRWQPPGVLERLHRQHDARPAADEPGTLHQQLEAISLYLSDPARRIDANAAWAAARRLAMPHARRGNR